MRVLLISGSRADLGSLEPVYQALIRHQVESTLIRSESIFDGLKLNQAETAAHFMKWAAVHSIDYSMVIVCGDRFEILGAVIGVFLNKIPIVHLSGGDITEGSADDSMRHAISKLSHLHYTATVESAKHVIQMGDEPWRVKVVGEPSVDNLKLMDLKDAKKEAGIERFASNFCIVLYHPDTLVDNFHVLAEAIIVTGALSRFNNDMLVIGPNTDVGNEQIRQHFNSWASLREVEAPTHYVENLPRQVYLTLLANCSTLIGNSSSGYFEAPSFGTPVVDIGDRQKGRIKSANIVHCGIVYNEIIDAVNTALKKERIEITNPYHTGSAADQIAHDISRIKDPRKLLLKRFYQIRH